MQSQDDTCQSPLRWNSICQILPRHYRLVMSLGNDQSWETDKRVIDCQISYRKWVPSTANVFTQSVTVSWTRSSRSIGFQLSTPWSCRSSSRISVDAQLDCIRSRWAVQGESGHADDRTTKRNASRTTDAFLDGRESIPRWPWHSSNVTQWRHSFSSHGKWKRSSSSQNIGAVKRKEHMSAGVKIDQRT